MTAYRQPYQITDVRTKSYICEFRNKKFMMPDNRTFLKFGITRHSNVEDRFDCLVDDGYNKSDYADWDITVKFSMWHPTMQDAEHWKMHWLNQKFPYDGPNKVWVEKILGCPTEDYYRQDSGISELRLVTLKQVGWIMYKAYQQKRELLA